LEVDNGITAADAYCEYWRHADSLLLLSLFSLQISGKSLTLTLFMLMKNTMFILPQGKVLD